MKRTDYQRPKCRFTGKRTFRSSNSINVALHRLEHGKDTFKRNLNLHSYICPHCGEYHMTSQEDHTNKDS